MGGRNITSGFVLASLRVPENAEKLRNLTTDGASCTEEEADVRAELRGASDEAMQGGAFKWMRSCLMLLGQGGAGKVRGVYTV